MQEHRIHQWHKEAGGTPCNSERFGPGKWVKLNSNVVWLNLWYLKGLELRVACSELKWRLKGNMMNSGEREVRHQERNSTWCGVQGGQGENWWWWRSVGWNWRVQIQAKERRQGFRRAYPVEQPNQTEQHRMGREAKSLEWNGDALNRGWGGDWWVSILAEKRRQKGSM